MSDTLQFVVTHGGDNLLWNRIGSESRQTKVDRTSHENLWLVTWKLG